MKCDECLAQLYSFIDAEVDGEAATFLQQHLDECAPCFDRSQLERAFRTTLRARLAGHPVPDGLESRLRSALDHEDATRPRRRPPSAASAPVPGGA